jgi:GDPmannose 4,6-dehydratase
MPRTALITGITGQDGSYITEYLLELGYTVYGLLRRTSAHTFGRVSHLRDRIQMLNGDILDQNS